MWPRLVARDCHAGHTIDGWTHTTGFQMQTSYVMKISRNGQVSIPADARARWNADRVVVVDLGDRVVMRPVPADPVGELVGKYRRGPATDTARRRARSDEAMVASRRRRRR